MAAEMETGRRKSLAGAWLKQLRPHHWVKNVFILAPLVFSGGLADPEAVTRAALFFASFCMLASAVYVFNDVLDRERDREHPKKRHRPIAAGRIGLAQAWTGSLLLVAGGLAVAASLGWKPLLVAAVYIANNVAYCLVLKTKVVADALSISIGFMLRFIGGAFAIGVEPSRWLMVCGFALSLFLAFGKRRAELVQMGERAGTSRPVLLVYDPAKLDSALSVANALSILSYLLFVTDPEGGGRYGDGVLVYTLPLVVYCLIRYMFKAVEGAGTGPVEILLKDRAFVAAGALWFVIVLIALYA